MVRPRPVLAERRHRAHNQTRVACAEGLEVEPEVACLLRAQCVYENIGALDEREGLLAVEDNGPLADVVVPELQASFDIRLVVDVRTDVPRRNAISRFDFDDVGTEA